jgi:NADH:ubiquinone reductase (H+-translocating)
VRIVVVGGGYAGLACLARLARLMPDAERHLVDPGRWHLRRTLLHETLRRPLAELRAGFGPIARRWGFRHHRARADWSAPSLPELSRTACIRVTQRELGFDALVLAAGLPGAAHPATRAKPPPVALDSLATGRGVAAYRRLVREAGPVWVIGAGASGLQCLFELAAARPPGAPLGLVEAENDILAAEPQALRRAVFRRLEKIGVDLRLGTRYAGFGRGHVRLQSRGRAFSAPAAGVLLCTGPTVPRITADAAGRVLAHGRPLPRIYAAGDCATWTGVPYDAATAQTAVRKGRHVAETIARVAQGRAPQAWDAEQLGFFLSLGPQDAIGWLFARAALVNGLPAVAAREAVEARWDLLLRGLDSFAAF